MAKSIRRKLKFISAESIKLFVGESEEEKNAFNFRILFIFYLEISQREIELFETDGVALLSLPSYCMKRSRGTMQKVKFVKASSDAFG